MIISQTKEFYEQLCLRNMRLRGFIYGRKSMDNFLDRIEGAYGKDVVLGWGNWSRSSQMKGCMSTPGKGLRKIVSKRFTTYLVDEYKTSKICNWCDKELNNKSVGGNKIYRCLVCEGCLSQESKKEIRRFINRDINGGLNIRRCLKEWVTDRSRPSSLQRTKSSDKDLSNGLVQKRTKKEISKDRNVSIKIKMCIKLQRR